jgi:glycosyltransferase involved in cell wall biosynthesis
VRIEIVGGTPLLRKRTARATSHLSQSDTDDRTWFVRAGAWSFDSVADVPASATGKPLLAFGAVRGDPTWQKALADTGGVLSSPTSQPPVASLLADDADAICERLNAGESLDDVAWSLARDERHRAVRVHALDVDWDERLRVCIAVPTLHRGGAERIALGLHAELGRRGTPSLFAVMSSLPGAATYEPPDGAVQLATARDRVAALAEKACAFGADVIHTHLFAQAELGTLVDLGIPIVVTIHNDRARWAVDEGFDAVTHPKTAATLACSWRAHEQLGAGALGRVAPNFATCSTLQDRESARRRLELPAEATMVLCVANARKQKRLALAVETLAVVRSRGRDARLVIAGGTMPGEESAAGEIDEAVARHDLGPFVRRVGTQVDLVPLYAAADVLLTTSLYEGMSVAQLEALAARVPVVTTDVGGASELARTHDGAYVVVAASAAALADAIDHGAPRPSLHASFEVSAAAQRHVRVYRGAATRAATDGGLVLVINNFATGGAQASARRLLLGLRARGHDVAAAVVQEQARFPTPWRSELERAMPVLVAPRSDPSDTAATVAAFVRERRARTVVFWNVIPACKLLVADELVGCAFYDVSPGEMYFAELARYFAKPRHDLPYFDARDYGTLLDGVVVKYGAEAEQAKSVLDVNVTVIPNGIEVGPAPARRPRGPRIIVGTLARLSPDKKLEQLLEAMRALPRACELRIAGRVARGDETYAEGLRVAAQGLPVTFVGDVDATRFLADLDLFAMVSEPAGCPNALLEAMAVGLPIAATDAGGAREIVGDAGLIVARGDGRALGDALRRLVFDVSLGQDLGCAAHARATAKHSLELMVDRYEALLAE